MRTKAHARSTNKNGNRASGEQPISKELLRAANRAGIKPATSVEIPIEEVERWGRILEDAQRHALAAPQREVPVPLGGAVAALAAYDSIGLVREDLSSLLKGGAL